MAFYLKDPKTGKASVTLTMFVVGFLVATGKLLVAGMTIVGFKMEAFTGVDYAAAVAALGGVYTLRKNNTIKKDNTDGQS
jgi:hypothetical protein